MSTPIRLRPRGRRGFDQPLAPSIAAITVKPKRNSAVLAGRGAVQFHLFVRRFANLRLVSFKVQRGLQGGFQSIHIPSRLSEDARFGAAGWALSCLLCFPLEYYTVTASQLECVAWRKPP